MRIQATSNFQSIGPAGGTEPFHSSPEQSVLNGSALVLVRSATDVKRGSLITRRSCVGRHVHRYLHALARADHGQIQDITRSDIGGQVLEIQDVPDAPSIDSDHQVKGFADPA